jgi:hypothetical protein
MILYVLIDNDPDLVEVSYLIQHIKTGYDDGVWNPFTEYLETLKKYTLTDFDVPAMPTLKGVVRGYFGDRWNKFHALPDEDKLRKRARARLWLLQPLLLCLQGE